MPHPRLLHLAIPKSAAPRTPASLAPEEIPHVQGQRSPSRTVGVGEVAAECWSNFLEMPVHCRPAPPQEVCKHRSVSVSVGSLGPGVHKVCLSTLSISGGSGV